MAGYLRREIIERSSRNETFSPTFIHKYSPPVCLSYFDCHTIQVNDSRTRAEEEDVTTKNCFVDYSEEGQRMLLICAVRFAAGYRKPLVVIET